MIFHRILPTAVLLIATSLATAQTVQHSDKDFAAELAARGERYRKIDEKRHLSLALHGRLLEAVSELENTVPPIEKTPMDDLILGDMLYSLDPTLAEPHHRRAYAAYPDQVETMSPMSMHYQRLGRLDSALAIYEKLAARGKLTDVQYALMAQCYVHAGMLDKGVDAWTRANYGKSSTAIDFAIQSIFGRVNPVVRHDSLFKQVHRGQADKIGPLLDLGVAWDADWWNVSTNREALMIDLDEISRTFGASSPVARETRILLQALAAREKGRGTLEGLLRQERLIIGDGSLPATTLIAKHLMDLSLEAGLLKIDELDRRFHGELVSRINRPEGDRTALDILISFAESGRRKEELAALNRRGWHDYDDPRYVFPLLAQRLWSGDGTLKVGDDTLALAIGRYPHDSRFAGIAYKLALDDGSATSRDVARVIDAEYYGLLSDRGHTSDALNALFGNLGDALIRERRTGK